MPLEVALADIRRCSGTQFDPALTEAFLSIPTDKLREILRQQDGISVDEDRNSNRVIIPTSVATVLPGKAA